MKVIIMAAGIGARLNSILGDKPKCLLTIDGQTMIRRIIDLFHQRDIKDITVITGYNSHLIHQELAGCDVQFFHNPFFQVTNSIASLWLARELLTEDTILMNADLFFEEEILDLALKQSKDCVMLSDCTRIENADFRFGVQGDRIYKAGNQLENHETDCEYVGIVRIDGRFISTFKNRLSQMISEGDFRNWWEGVLYMFITDGLPVHHVDVSGIFWSEVDNLADYNRLQAWVSGEQSASMEQSVPA
ncbi:MAG: phosphocholine cytidylyltransferase family protein [Proteobacteria bacterium]|nr:phosphocholine cytidylyltransferase family protein [Pseudomonadota bacterium]